MLRRRYRRRLRLLQIKRAGSATASSAIPTHEAEHRTKNILATVQAAVRLSHSNTLDDLKRLIEGRINALARSIRCSWNRVGREPSYTVWSRKSFYLTATGDRNVYVLTARP
jgi:hypothetical protein